MAKWIRYCGRMVSLGGASWWCFLVGASRGSADCCGGSVVGEGRALAQFSRMRCRLFISCTRPQKVAPSKISAH